MAPDLGGSSDTEMGDLIDLSLSMIASGWPQVKPAAEEVKLHPFRGRGLGGVYKHWRRTS